MTPHSFLLQPGFSTSYRGYLLCNRASPDLCLAFYALFKTRFHSSTTNLVDGSSHALWWIHCRTDWMCTCSAQGSSALLLHRPPPQIFQLPTPCHIHPKNISKIAVKNILRMSDFWKVLIIWEIQFSFKFSPLFHAHSRLSLALWKCGKLKLQNLNITD